MVLSAVLNCQKHVDWGGGETEAANPSGTCVPRANEVIQSPLMTRKMREREREREGRRRGAGLEF